MTTPVDAINCSLPVKSCQALVEIFAFMIQILICVTKNPLAQIEAQGTAT